MTSTRSSSSAQPNPRAILLQLARVLLQARDQAGLTVRRTAEDEVQPHQRLAGAGRPGHQRRAARR